MSKPTTCPTCAGSGMMTGTLDPALDCPACYELRDQILTNLLQYGNDFALEVQGRGKSNINRQLKQLQALITTEANRLAEERVREFAERVKGSIANVPDQTHTLDMATLHIPHDKMMMAIDQILASYLARR
jgi:hypothetical protein